MPQLERLVIHSISLSASRRFEIIGYRLLRFMKRRQGPVVKFDYSFPGILRQMANGFTFGIANSQF